jgi:phosphopantetheinyl transferase (holo-ACP synthase)
VVSLERVITAELEQEVVLAYARAPLGREELTVGELEGLACVTTDERATQWLRGRAALRRVMSRRGEEPDTSTLRFPHCRYSLTHSNALAVAVAGDACGLGVDFEPLKRLRNEVARFFLTDAEHSWIDSLPAVKRSAQLLRLWTVKEALFKADAHNDRRTLRDYALQSPWAITGVAETPDSAPQRYTTARTAGGLLSVAITRN